MVNDFLAKWAPDPKQRLVQSINDLVGIMRQYGNRIIWVRQEFEPNLSDAFPEMKTKDIRITIRGTAGSQIDPDLAVAHSDPVVIKKRYSAFYNTDLDQLLHRWRPDGLFWPGLIRMPASG
jgi:nicotinamidase-related amidase